MSKGEFIGVGIGPGDPELVTVKAVEIIKRADAICLPRSKNKVESIALSIIKSYCNGAKLIDMVYSMAHDQKKRVQYWQEHAETICSMCDEGQTVAFVTLGDPGLYSTFAYVSELVRHMRPQLPIQIIPGISSVPAICAAAGLSLAQADECVTIQPCPQILEKNGQWWNQFDCVVIMKIGRKFPLLIQYLSRNNLLKEAILVKNAGFENCLIIRAEELLQCTNEQGYLATMIVRPQKNLEKESV